MRAPRTPVPPPTQPAIEPGGAAAAGSATPLSFREAYGNHVTIAVMALFVGACMLVHRLRHGSAGPVNVPIHHLMGALRANQPFLLPGAPPSPEQLPKVSPGDPLWPAVTLSRGCMNLELGRGAMDATERAERFAEAEAAFLEFQRHAGNDHPLAAAAHLAYGTLCEETENQVQMNLQIDALLTNHPRSPEAAQLWHLAGLEPKTPGEEGFDEAQQGLRRALSQRVRDYAEARAAAARAAAAAAPEEAAPPGDGDGTPPPPDDAPSPGGDAPPPG